jgi:hypothetical protein
MPEEFNLRVTNMFTVKQGFKFGIGLTLGAALTGAIASFFIKNSPELRELKKALDLREDQPSQN